MKEILQRLGADMHWRLLGGGKSWEPKSKERESWGARRISGATNCLVWLGLSVLSFGVINVLMVGNDSGSLVGFARLLISLPATALVNLILLPLVFISGRALERRWDLKAYRKLLAGNESFMLSEYYKYLERQAKRTEMGELGGGTAEAIKLATASAQVREILDAKIADNKKKTVPPVGEAALAQSVVEAYSIGVIDPLKELDSRLSEQQRLKVADLERSLQLPTDSGSEKLRQ